MSIPFRNEQLAMLGVPSSAGARRTGQEAGPSALREAGLVSQLRRSRLALRDHGDLDRIVFRPDPENPRRQNRDLVGRVARNVADAVETATRDGSILVVLGGDCSITLGVVAGLVRNYPSLGLVYLDGDLDLNTPDTTLTGIFDGMVAAHLLGRGDRELTTVGPRVPLLTEEALVFLGYNAAGGGIDPHELSALARSSLLALPAERLREDPEGTAREALTTLEERVDHILLHFDVDVTDTQAVDVPHRGGVPLDATMAALRVLTASRKLAGLVVTELNPELDPTGATVRLLADQLAEILRSVGAD